MLNLNTLLAACIEPVSGDREMSTGSTLYVLFSSDKEYHYKLYNYAQR